MSLDATSATTERPRPDTVPVVGDEDYGWLGVGGEDTGRLGGSRRDIRRLMRLAMQASNLITAATDTEAWRAETGMQALYLVLRPVEAQKEPSITPVGRGGRGRTFVVDNDWYGLLGDDDRTAGWLLAGHLLLVLAALAEQSAVALPALPAVGRG